MSRDAGTVHQLPNLRGRQALLIARLCEHIETAYKPLRDTIKQIQRIVRRHAPDQKEAETYNELIIIESKSSVFVSVMVYRTKRPSLVRATKSSSFNALRRYVTLFARKRSISANWLTVQFGSRYIAIARRNRSVFAKRESSLDDSETQARSL